MAFNNQVLLVNIESAFEGAFEDLIKFQSSFVVVEVDKVPTAVESIQKNPPKAVIVADGVVVLKKYHSFLTCLMSYVARGGIVALAGFFSSMVRMDDLETFFSAWNLPWKPGSYHRSDFVSNSNSHFSKIHSKLPDKYSMKTLHLKNVAPESRVYIPAPNSTTQSHVFAHTAITDFEQCAIAFEKFGKGYLGYVGDVNNEKSTIDVVFKMCSTPTNTKQLQISQLHQPAPKQQQQQQSQPQQSQQPQQQTQQPQQQQQSQPQQQTQQPQQQKQQSQQPQQQKQQAQQQKQQQQQQQQKQQTKNQSPQKVQVPQTPICQYFAMGKCKFGAKCKFSHAPAQVNTNVNSFIGKSCAKCGQPAVSRCGKCKSVDYCSKKCQSADWGKHKGECSSSAMVNMFANMFSKPIYNDKKDDSSEDEEYDDSDDDEASDSDDEYSQRMENGGFTQDELMELLAQGVKPWDDDAWDVLEALRG